MKETISAIQEQYRRLDKTDDTLLRSFAESLMADERAAVKQIAGRALREAEKLSQERARLEKMRLFERACEKEGFTYICGIDEAGRGPLAGPVVAGAVILPKDCEILYLNDSKKLSEKRREELYEEVMEKAVAAGAGIVGSRRIDEINILQADYEACGDHSAGQDSAEEHHSRGREEFIDRGCKYRSEGHKRPDYDRV